MKKILILVLTITSLQVFAQSNNFTQSIEKKHQKTLFLSKKYITYNIDIKFGGKQHLLGKISQETGGGKIKIEKNDGSVIVFDGTNVYAKGVKKEALAGARFDIFTWSYFLGLPYKLNDNGTIWSDFNKNKWGAEMLPSAKLSFSSNTGDAPDDWYVVYKNAENVIAGAAYIVSFGKGKAAAEKEPHAIKYNTIENVDGIPFAKNWTFHMWSLNKGYGKQIGEVQLSNIIFKNQLDFKIPEASVLVNLPKF